MANFDLIVSNMVELDGDALMEQLRGIMSEDGKYAAEALEALQEGMAGVGDRFESGEYFLADLMFAADIMTTAVEIIKPALSADAGTRMGRIILATVKGDVHDIGKNIVKSILESSGFEVLDLGIDVPADTIVDTAKGKGVKIIALSGVLTLAIESMKGVVEALKSAGIRDDVKVIIGGNPVTEEACKAVGADAWTRSPKEGVTICRGWAKA